MDHLEAVVQIDNIIDDDFCNDIIKIIDEKCHKSMTTMGGLDINIRNVLGLTLDNKKNKILYEKINKKIEELYVYYKIKFKTLDNNKINQIDLLKYNPGGKYEVHVDTKTDYTRSISVILNLNDTYEGGNLLFTNPLKVSEELKELKLKKGTVVFFPSTFMYPHGIQPITKGTRYSIVSWLQ
tara:strand:- start:169 stop:714 length:546 start_codon:yes stop_codon:yes gene_type:complete